MANDLSSTIRDALQALTAMVRNDDASEIRVPELDLELVALAGEAVPAIERQVSPPLMW